jgi:hypothetical protein
MKSTGADRVSQTIFRHYIAFVWLLGIIGLIAIFTATPVAFAQGTDELPDPPTALTFENQVQYANTVMADTRPVVLGDDNGSKNYYFRQLRQLKKVLVKFTWDQVAVKSLSDQSLLLMVVIEDISEDLIRQLDSKQGVYLKTPLSKVKEIHLTTTTKKADQNEFGHNHGFFLSFDKKTGVLTAAMSTSSGVNSVAADSSFGEWIAKYIK